MIYDDTVTPEGRKPLTSCPQTPSANQQVEAAKVQSLTYVRVNPIQKGMKVSVKTDSVESIRGHYVRR